MNITEQDTQSITVAMEPRTIRVGAMCKIMYSEGMLGIDHGTVRIDALVDYKDVDASITEPYLDNCDTTNITDEAMIRSLNEARESYTTQPWVKYHYLGTLAHSVDNVWYLPLEEFVNHTIYY